MDTISAVVLRPRTLITLERVVIIGSSCSGKTTMAKQVAAILQVAHIELDALHWLPEWQERPDSEFRELVASAVAAERWVVDGNYNMVRDVVWQRATTLVWLNHSFPVVFWQAVSRTVIRSIGHRTLFSGNKESIRQAFFSRDSMILWVIKTFHERRRSTREVFDGDEFPGLHRVELRNRADANRFFTSLRDI
jgi:adenylate kinase family enzyme